MNTKQRDANDILREEGTDGLRARIDAAGSPQGTFRLLKSQQEFLAGFVPPDYLVDGVLQRRFIYSLTARTGDGKTAVALLLSRSVACIGSAWFGSHAVERGKVVYLVGENPDDVRCRIIGANAHRRDDPNRDRIHFIPGVFDIVAMRELLAAEAQQLDGVDLIIVDTSAAYFLQQDENSNPQMGTHARMLRSLTMLPGGPCVVTLCHPHKWANQPSELLPRGGGAYLAEMDGNLTLWKHDDNLVTLRPDANKFRGPGFEPITFRLEKITTPELVDRKERQLPTVQAVAISEREEEQQAAEAEHDEDQLLDELNRNSNRSVAKLARACNWFFVNGEPYKSKAQRVLDRLEKAKLVKKVRGRHWCLTPEGKKALKGDDDDETEQRIDDRSGAHSKKPFHALRGMKQGDTVPCAYCGKAGDVYKFADGRLPKGKRHHAALHADCAEPFFAGKPKPNDGELDKTSPGWQSRANGGSSKAPPQEQQLRDLGLSDSDISEREEDSSSGIAFMITAKMKRDLRERGLSDQEISELTPQHAHIILADNVEMTSYSSPGPTIPFPSTPTRWWLNHETTGDDPVGKLIAGMRRDPDIPEWFESPEAMERYFEIKRKFYVRNIPRESIMALWDRYEQWLVSYESPPSDAPREQEEVPGRAALAAVLTAWGKAFGCGTLATVPFLVDDVMSLDPKEWPDQPGLREIQSALLAVAEGEAGKIDPARLEQWLRKNSGIEVGQLTLRERGADNAGVQWTVTRGA